MPPSDPNIGRFTDMLREAAEPHWTRMTSHRFVREIGAGTLDDAVAARYLIQDYAFIDAFVSLLGHALALAPSMPSKRPFAQFAAAVTAEENDYFLRSFTALSVPESAWSAAEPAAPTRGFIDLIDEAGRSRTYGAVLSVLVAAEWSYLTWAKSCPPARPEKFWLADWIDLHDNPAFEGFVTWLRTETDRAADAADAATRARMTENFRRMMALEEAFFDAAYG
jgi:thiaminase/transcriptional activator TenA